MMMLRAVTQFERNAVALVKPRAQDVLAACKTLATGPAPARRARGVLASRRGINIAETSLDILTLKDERE